MKKIVVFLLCSLVGSASFAQGLDSINVYVDSVEHSLSYQRGEIKLGEGIGTLVVPQGFKYLDEKQTKHVLETLWGNPDGGGTQGMIVPETMGVMGDNSWAFILSYDDMGFVKDDDADEIEYDELLEEMQGDMEASNEERKKMGYEPIALVGWASPPFYDKDHKVLHWAKELKFGESETNTLNYNVRILGRKGVMVMNAVATMGELDEVKKNINPVLASFSFSEGNRYKDFDPGIDEVAGWTIGGLVAGKVLAKAGFFVFFLKYIKLIGLALAGLGGGIWKWYKRKTDPPTVRDISGNA